MANFKSLTLKTLLIIFTLLIFLSCGGTGSEKTSGNNEEGNTEEETNNEEIPNDTQNPDTFAAIPIITTDYLGYKIGTGIIMDTKGYILTSAHLVSNYQPILVQNPVSKAFEPVTLIGSSPTDDLALLKVDQNIEQYIPGNFGKSSELSPGDEVYTFGYDPNIQCDPNTQVDKLVGITPSFKQAEINQIRVDYEYYGLENTIQIDVNLNSSHSGGPLFNSNNQIVGINTVDYEGMSDYSYSISIEVAQTLMPVLIQGDVKNLGAHIIPHSFSLSEKCENPFIENRLVIFCMDLGSPLYETGWYRYDILCEADGIELGYPGDLYGIIKSKNPGEEIIIKGIGLYEDGVYRTYETTIFVP